MRIVSIKRCLVFGMLLTGGTLFAQDPIGSETVTVIKPYTPEVGDANKLREMPTRGDSLGETKKPVQYRIFSVPVASTFTPAKGQASTVERRRPERVFDNYATLGFGNYTNVLAEFYSNLEVNRTDNFGIFLTHNSSQGGIDGLILDDKFYDSELNLSYNSRNRNLSWKTEVGGEHRLFNWYGLPEELSQPEEFYYQLDPQQNYFSVYAGGELDLYDSFFDTAKARFRHSGDSYSSAENHFNANAIFELNIADELITTNLYADIVNGKFEESLLGGGSDYTFMNFGIAPSLLILRDDLSLNLGLGLFYSLDAENSSNSFYIYPQVTASYRLAGDYFTAYAGLEGDLKQNTYYQFFTENPYLAPGVEIMPTDSEYNGYLGAKGKLGEFFGYNFRGSYMSEFNKALFQRNAYYPASGKNYGYGNSFGLVYDDVRTLSFFAELNVDVNRNFRMSLNGEFLDYNTDQQAEAWNLPTMKASLNADYQITEKWYAGANFFYVGERKDLDHSIEITNSMIEAPQVITVDSFLDLNAHLGYRFNEQLSIFAKGSNLLNNNYQQWTNFQVQGIQVLAGATYKFDF
ncbi:TonB-dependent receptor [Salegentibacter sp. HM20]